MTGATGNVGRELAALLPQARTLDRSSGADLAQPDTLDDALQGVETVFLVWPFLTSDGADAVLTKIAERARRVVYLSSSAVRFGADTDPITRLHADLETAVQASGLAWTVLRADTFASNALGWAGQLRAGDVVRGPDSAATAVIDPADIATAAAAVLRDSQAVTTHTQPRTTHTQAGTTHIQPGTIHMLTGPDVLSRGDQVRVLGEVLGRELTFDATPFDDARAQLLADGRPPALVEALIGSAQNRPASDLVTTTVQDLTGRPARTFHAWADRHRATFA